MNRLIQDDELLKSTSARAKQYVFENAGATDSIVDFLKRQAFLS
jgi:hypothetical protein